MSHDCTRAIIDLDAVSSNFDAVCRKANVPVMAVIKADAYGHGAVQVARLLKDKCAFFCVSSILEALELRDAGLTTPILILGYTPTEAFPTAILQDIRPTIYRLEDGKALSQAACFLNLTAKFHFAVDTGMSRIGFQVTEEDADICAEIAALPGIQAGLSHMVHRPQLQILIGQLQQRPCQPFRQMIPGDGLLHCRGEPQ